MRKFAPASGKIHVSRAGAKDDGGKKEPLGTLRSPEFTIDDELRGKLSGAEVEEIEAYVGRARKMVQLELDYAAATFAETLVRVSDWVKTADPAELEAFNERVRKPLTKLRRQLAKGARDADDGDED